MAPSNNEIFIKNIIKVGVWIPKIQRSSKKWDMGIMALLQEILANEKDNR